MRGVFEDQGGLFSCISLEERVPAEHPLQKIFGGICGQSW
jgi:hypothetical protein